MKVISIPNYSNHKIRGIDNIKISHDEFCEHIDFNEVEEKIHRIYHTYNQYGDTSDYITDLMMFFDKGIIDKSDIYIRHCDTYLRKQENEYMWRVQLHISIRAYPSIIQVALDRRIKDKPYMIGFSGNKDLILSFQLNYIR